MKIKNQLEIRKNINECVALIRQGATLPELRAFWTSKGYKHNTANGNISKCYIELQDELTQQYPYVRDTHISLYQQIIYECFKKKNYRLAILAMERIEKILGLEKQNINQTVTIEFTESAHDAISI